MSKNSTKTISLKQYRATDLFIFAVILVAFELLIHFAYIGFNGDFIFSPMVPIVLLVMMRWGWVSVFYAVGDGILYCLINMGSENFNNYYFAIYTIGNAFIALLLLSFLYPGKGKISQKWYLSLIFALLGWFFVVLGRSIVAACLGINFLTALLSQLSDLLSMGIAVLLILVLRRLDGMFEDQKSYLLRLDRERKEMARRDEFGDEPIDIDEDCLSILNKRDNDLY
jgi:hypothetical protein